MLPPQESWECFCTAQGLTGAQVKSLTKHKQDVFDKDYLCELCIEVMTTIAGFRPNDPNDTYYIPRAQIGMPGILEAEEIAVILFPKIGKWREQQMGINGDKSESAKEFLYSVIIYLTQVIVQDGVLWVSNHGQNTAISELTRLLDGKTGRENYLKWCEHKLRDIKNDVKKINNAKKKLTDVQRSLSSALSQTEQLNRELKLHLDSLVSNASLNDMWVFTNLYSI